MLKIWVSNLWIVTNDIRIKNKTKQNKSNHPPVLGRSIITSTFPRVSCNHLSVQSRPPPCHPHPLVRKETPPLRGDARRESYSHRHRHHHRHHRRRLLLFHARSTPWSFYCLTANRKRIRHHDNAFLPWKWTFRVRLTFVAPLLTSLRLTSFEGDVIWG